MDRSFFVIQLDTVAIDYYTNQKENRDEAERKQRVTVDWIIIIL